jgi:hypothetical protein
LSGKIFKQERTFKVMSLAFAMSILLTSCFSYTSVVGNGGQNKTSVTQWNHYVIWWTAQLEFLILSYGCRCNRLYCSYRQSFVNGLIALAFSICQQQQLLLNNLF